MSVRASTLSIIKKEIHRAYVLLKKRADDFESTISSLYEPIINQKIIDYLSDKLEEDTKIDEVPSNYTCFLKVDIQSENSSDLYKLAEFVHSKLRFWNDIQIDSLAVRVFPNLYDVSENQKFALIGLKYIKCKYSIHF